GSSQLAFDIANGFIAEITGQTAGKSRQTLIRRCLEPCLVCLDEVQWINVFGRLHHGFVLQHFYMTASSGESGMSWQTDDGIAAETFASLHRFQQIGVGLVGQFEIKRQGRIKVGKSLDDQWYAVITLAR